MPLFCPHFAFCACLDLENFFLAPETTQCNASELIWFFGGQLVTRKRLDYLQTTLFGKMVGANG